MVVGSGAVSLLLLTLLSSGDDNIVSITTNIDHAAQITVGVVERIARMVLMVGGSTLAAQGSLLVENPAALIEIHFLLPIFQLDDNHHAWRSKRRIMVEAGLDFCRLCWAWSHVVRKLFVEVVGVVVVKADALRGIVFRIREL